MRYRVIQSVHPRFSITRTYDGVRREASREQDGKVAYPPATEADVDELHALWSSPEVRRYP